MTTLTLKKFAAVTLAILLLVFVGYQVFRQNYGGVRTERAVYGNAWDSIEVSAVMIRSETYITADTAGVVRYEVSSGSHIGKGGTVASVYGSEEEAKKAADMESLQKQILQLQRLNGFAEGSGLSPDTYDEAISENLMELRLSVEQKDLSGVEAWRQELLYSLNQKQIASGKTESYDGKIAELQNEYETVRSSFGGAVSQITAPSAGYFVGSTDGYENLYSFDDVLNLTAEDLKATPQRQSVPENTIGKICDEYKWYIAFTVDKSRAVDFKNIMDSYDDQVYLFLPFSTVKEIPAKVVAVNQDDFNADSAVVLECSYMDESISTLRFEEVQIELYSYSGIMVSQNNIHFADVEETITDDDGNETVVVHENVQGVYVVNGATMAFVQIFPKATVNGYVVCKTQPGEGDSLYTSDTIDLYDEVITEGKDLYDGKFIE